MASGNKDDEKYAKAAKKSQRHVMAVLAASALILVVLLLLRYVTGSASSSSNSSSSPFGPALKKSQQQAQQQQQQHQDADYAAEDLSVSVEELEASVVKWDGKVREIKGRVDIFETDGEAQAAAKSLQDATRRLLHKRYGRDSPETPYRVVVQLEFQDTISDFAEHGKDGAFTIELAPSSLQPHSIYTFLEVARHWNGGAFHRIANHVLQVMVKTHTIKHLAFQEYSPDYPHRERTVGYAGRPSGPAWYVSIQDNSKNHGPGSQQKHNPYEADSCFGRVVEGYEHVLRIKKVEGMGFLGDAKKHVLITRMTIQVPQRDGTYADWQEDPSQQVAKAF
jgi:cyclophilin family peptidyl-prolyl cis-trans isomerase